MDMENKELNKNIENKEVNEDTELEEKATLKNYKAYKASIEVEKKVKALKAANHINCAYESINENDKFLYIVDKLFDMDCPFIIIRTLYLMIEPCIYSNLYGAYINDKSDYSGFDKDYIRMEFDYLKGNYSKDGSDKIVHSTFITSELYDDIAYLIDTIILNRNPSIVNDTVMFLFNTTNRLLNEYTIYDIRDIEVLHKFLKMFNRFLTRASKMDDVDYKPLGKLMEELIDDRVVEFAKFSIGIPGKKAAGTSNEDYKELCRKIAKVYLHGEPMDE